MFVHVYYIYIQIIWIAGATSSHRPAWLTDWGGARPLVALLGLVTLGLGFSLGCRNVVPKIGGPKIVP